jgi:RNA methyltransferase, TrmH family
MSTTVTATSPTMSTVEPQQQTKLKTGVSDPITSPRNPRLKALRRLHRHTERERTGHFLAEGEDLVDAARRAGRRPLEGYRASGAAADEDAFVEVAPQALKAISTLASGSRVIGVYEQRWCEVHGPLCVYLHAVADPGNVGTVLRSAHVFGASCVALGPGCADPHSPKAVRASMGAIFSVDVARVADTDRLPGDRIALLPDAPELLCELEVALERERTLLVGGERDGLPAEVVAGCERTARLAHGAESLNAAMAAAVALYELSRGASVSPASSRVRHA